MHLWLSLSSVCQLRALCLCRDAAAAAELLRAGRTFERGGADETQRNTKGWQGVPGFTGTRRRG